MKFSFYLSGLSVLMVGALVGCHFTPARPSIDRPTERGAGAVDFQVTPECVRSGERVLANPICQSVEFPIRPGHHQFTVELLGNKLEDALPDVLTASLSLFDRNGAAIPVEVPYLDRLLELDSLDSSLLTPVSGADFKADTSYTITLQHRPYPADSNWIPTGAHSAKITFRYSGQGQIALKNLQIRESTWNLPAWERTECSSGRAASAKRPPQIAVMSQGPLARQYPLLQSALSHQIADTYLLELSPESFIGKEVSPQTKELALLLEKSSTKWGIAYHPYWQTEPQKKPSSFQVSSDEEIKTIQERIAWFLARGASVVILRADDLVPQAGAKPFGYTLTNKADIRRFKSLAAAHLYLIARVLTPLPTSVAKYFVPPWYSSFFVRNNPSLASAYFKQLATLTDTIGIFWTGPSVRSLNIDQIELDAFRRLTGNLPLPLWDNTLYARRHKDFWGNRPERQALLSYFEPYHVTLPQGYLSYDTTGEDLVLVNGELNAFNQVQMKATKEFYTSKDVFCPYSVIDEILRSRWNNDTAEEIKQLDTTYWSSCHRTPNSAIHCAQVEARLREIAEMGITP